MATNRRGGKKGAEKGSVGRAIKSFFSGGSGVKGSKRGSGGRRRRGQRTDVGEHQPTPPGGGPQPTTPKPTPPPKEGKTGPQTASGSPAEGPKTEAQELAAYRANRAKNRNKKKRTSPTIQKLKDKDAAKEYQKNKSRERVKRNRGTAAERAKKHGVEELDYNRASGRRYKKAAKLDKAARKATTQKKRDRLEARAQRKRERAEGTRKGGFSTALTRVGRTAFDTLAAVGGSDKVGKDSWKRKASETKKGYEARTKKNK